MRIIQLRFRFIFPDVLSCDDVFHCKHASLITIPLSVISWVRRWYMKGILLQRLKHAFKLMFMQEKHKERSCWMIHHDENHPNCLSVMLQILLKCPKKETLVHDWQTGGSFLLKINFAPTSWFFFCFCSIIGVFITSSPLTSWSTSDFPPGDAEKHGGTRCLLASPLVKSIKHG